MENERKLPEKTKYVRAGKFCCFFKKYYVPEINKYFIEHWEISKKIPLFVIITLTISYFVYILIHGPFLHIRPFFYFIETLFYLLFFISYIQTIIEGPGYLPFYYPQRNEYKLPNETDLSGLVVTSQQLEYMDEYKKKLPPRTYFFRSARRIVIRPNHYCDWVASFVGKKNFKLFFLFNFYASLYLIDYFITMVFGLLYCVENKKFGLEIILIVVCIISSFMFFAFTCGVACGTFVEILANVTDWEEISKTEITWNTRNKIANCEEVCGSIKKFYTWPLPIGAFHGIDEYKLVYGYHESML